MICMYIHNMCTHGCMHVVYIYVYMYVCIHNPLSFFNSLKYSGSSSGVSGRNSSGMGRVWGMFSGIVSSSSESILISAHHTFTADAHLY